MEIRKKTLVDKIFDSVVKRHSWLVIIFSFIIIISVFIILSIYSFLFMSIHKNYPNRSVDGKLFSYGPTVLSPGDILNISKCRTEDMVLKKLIIYIHNNNSQMTLYERTTPLPHTIEREKGSRTFTRPHGDTKTSFYYKTSLKDESREFAVRLPFNLSLGRDLSLKLISLWNYPKTVKEIDPLTSEFSWRETEEILDINIPIKSFSDKWSLWVVLLFLSVIGEISFILPFVFGKYIQISKRVLYFLATIITILLIQFLGLYFGFFIRGILNSLGFSLTGLWSWTIVSYIVILDAIILSISIKIILNEKVAESSSEGSGHSP